MIRALPPLDPIVDEILAAEFVCSEEEVYQEFQESCERATCCGGIVPGDLQEAAKALAGMLERNHKAL